MSATPDPNDDLTTHARAAISSMLTSDDPSAARLALALGLSLRTLQRRLAAEGTSFSSLLDDARREKALPCIAAGEVSLGDLSASLRYSDQSALTRAVRRWTGCPPSGLRRR